MTKSKYFIFISTLMFVVILSIIYIIELSNDERLVKPIINDNFNRKEVSKKQDGILNSKKDVSLTTIIFGGDVMLGRSVMTISLKKDDFIYPFRYIYEVLEDADITFVNLESPVVKDCPQTNSGLKFCTLPQMLRGLKYSGVDIATLANNHITNYGEEGVSQTVKYLNEYGISYTGLEKLTIIEKNNTKFGFLGFNFTFKPPSKNDFNLIKESNDKVDVLIMSVHWGVEYKGKANESQRTWAREIIENGADLIIGHHPHWIQNNEYINGKVVYYSLGNLVFDQMWSEETKKGILVKVYFEGNNFIRDEKIPIYVKNVGQPVVVY